MATRLATADRRLADMTRQDSTGLASMGMARSGSGELVHSVRSKAAAGHPGPVAIHPLRPSARPQARTALSATLMASAPAEAPTAAGAKPVNFFPATFQPTAPGAARAVTTVKSSDEFWDQIDANPDRLVVLMSKSYGCRPCKAFNKKYERVAAQNKDAVFLEIFGDESEDTRDMMIDMCVKVTPTFHMFKGGRLCHMHTGINEDNLRSAVASHHPHYDPAQP